ncbi:MAG TPA: hypothetical protein VGB17_11270 [Pyrinomonadaceae bacterium]|jgi:hypothetical protein
MDMGAIVFSIILLLAGAFLVYSYLSAQTDEVPPEPARRAEHHTKLRQANRIKRQRSKVWWKVESLHQELMERTKGEADVSGSQVSSLSAPLNLVQRQADSCDRLNASQVSQAFEDFLRQTK